MSDERLKPCPFCGGEAVIRYDNFNKAYIECKHGCVRTPSYWTNLVIIIETWNTRKPMERIVERLEDKFVSTWDCGYEGGYKDAIVDAIKIVKGWSR